MSALDPLAPYASLTGKARAEAIAADLLRAEENQRDRRAGLLASYDYIVCGSGSSGSVVARRLADTGAAVLLLEAGPSDAQARIFTVQDWFLNLRDLDWGYRAEPNPAMNGRSITLAMGKVVGGGSSTNAMIWARGHRLDYEDWAAAAKDARWGYAHMLSIYRRIENWQGAPDPARRGSGGPVWVEPAETPSPLAQAMLESAAAAGLPVMDDHNGAMMEDGPGGCALANLRTRGGCRVSIAQSYLHPVLHLPNLTILPEAQVLRVLLEESRAVGVEVRVAGETRRFLAGREVVLCMGAMQTPHVLMHSGIGDGDALRRVGLPAAHHLPGVGQNFQDHMLVGSCIWEAPEPVERSRNYNECTFFWKSRDGLDRPDIQPFLFTRPHASDANRERISIPPNAWSIGPGLVRSRMRGYLRLRSADPAEPMSATTNLLDDDDVAAFRRSVALIRAIAAEPPLRRFAAREVLPGPAYGADLDSFIRNGATSYGHPTCTCKMGHDPMAVVDNELRVHGIEGLRIADGSIMPVITTGNTMAPCVLIGERMGELLSC